MISKFQGETRWLSNFAESDIIFEGRLYPTVENAYQAAKTLDIDARIPFEICTPREAKKLGYGLTLRPDWDKAKLQIMSWLNHQKYHIPEYRAKLKATGDQNLVEGNTWGDTFWGVCDGVGENHLGRIIMKIREEL
jgi:ribA/ribD-fused uncharacterized protein